VNGIAWLRPVLVACAGALVAAAAGRTPPLARLDLWAADRVQRFAAPPRTFDDTVIVDIDDASLARLQPVVGAWPYDRDLYARVVDYLTQAGARAIAIDILFADPRPGDAAFAAALQRSAPAAIAAVATPFAMADRPHDRVPLSALGWRLDAATPARSWRDVTLPRPELTSRASVGIVTMMPDEDGMVRRMPMFNRIDGAMFPSLPLAVRFAGEKPLATTGNGRIIVDTASWPVDANGEVQLLFGAAPYRITQVPFARVAEAALDLRDDEATQRLFRDRTVFIGSTALLLGDVNETPMGRVPGVVLAAHAYLSLTHDLVLRPKSWPWTLLLVLVALAPAVVVRVFHADALLRLTAATSAGLALSWGAALALLAAQHQPASIVTAWLAGLTTFVLFLTEKIRALRETRQRLTSERLAAERTTRLKSEFLAHVSHELRTPLTAILGFSRVLADEPSLAADKRPLVQIIRRNGEQLLWLVNNLLDQARIAAGQMSIEPRPTSVRDVIDQVLATLAGVPRRAGVELVSSCAAAVPSLVDVDGQRLQQIIINLAANALKFTERGRVYVGVDWDSDWLRVEVDDTGPGMRREVLEQIFEAFHQGEASAVMRGGTGLGLTISRNLARLMGGDLTVESTIGRGSTFRLRIPAVVVVRPATIVAPQASPGAAVESVVESPREPAVAATDGPRLRALIADDSEDIRALLQIFLRRIGMETIVAENGRRALEIALAERPDIVLMDVQMPEMGGVEAVQAMRRAGFTNSVVALTAGSGDDVAHELEAAGFSAVVFKPVTGDELTDAVVRLLGLESNAVARGSASSR
jgi:signal transduction histidine kinase/CheY-like chemotaxis protein